MIISCFCPAKPSLFGGFVFIMSKLRLKIRLNKNNLKKVRRNCNLYFLFTLNSINQNKNAMKVEYRIVEKFYDKNRKWYLVIKKIDHGNWFFNWLFNSHWGYINSDGEYIYGPWINAYTTTDKENAIALINYLKFSN